LLYLLLLLLLPFHYNPISVSFQEKTPVTYRRFSII